MDMQEKIIHPISHLRDVFFYDPLTGIVLWKINPMKKRSIAGTRAGCEWHTGYRYVRYQRVLYLEHRLVFALHYGRLPKIIDHINCDKSDNRIANLREATVAENNRNRLKMRTNTTGFKGVYFDKNSKKYIARCTLNRKQRNSGPFSTIEEAAKAYAVLAKEMHGEFART